MNITDCSFTGNEGERGGSISIKDGETFNVRNCTFERNRASNGGGAVDIEVGHLVCPISRILSSLESGDLTRT